jgi:thioredoxin 2
MTENIQIVCPHCDAINRVPAKRLGAGPRCGECHASLFQAKPVALSGERFQRQLHHSGIPLLVDFWASWCGPCRIMGPAFEAAAATLEPHMRLLKLSTEEVPDLAQQLHITSIPMLTLFSGGNERARHSGAMSTSQIVTWAREAA